MSGPPEGWSVPDRDGVCTRALDVGARSTLRGRRLRRRWGGDVSVLARWPAAWRTLLAAWLDGAPRRRWATLLKNAGHGRFQDAEALLSALLRSGLAEIEETRARGVWRPVWVKFEKPAELRSALGVPDTEALRASLQEKLDAAPHDGRLSVLWAELAQQPVARALERCALVQKLDGWIAEKRFGTRRDFALYARGGTKAVKEAEWEWLESALDLVSLGIERHTPALWLRAPLTLIFDAGALCLNVVPDAIALTPATLALLTRIDGHIECWRVVENRTSFERVARERGDTDGVIWLPGHAPEWWRQAVSRVLALKPAPAHIACDPDPAGIQIAVDAGAIWSQAGLSWTPWQMGVDVLLRLEQRRPLSENDRTVLERLSALSLPGELRQAAEWMIRHGEKGEQEGVL